jgi:predicted RNA-binding Zn-ribbon protein involved in translation (DUF1610 family)
MAYGSKNGRKPMEMASKANHSYIIHQPAVQQFLQQCVIPQPTNAAAVERLTVPVAPPTSDHINLIITIDGGYTEVSINDKYPSSSYAFYNFGGLLFEVADLEALHQKPFIEPEDMAKLRNIQRFVFVLPTKNVRIEGCDTLVESIRRAIFDFFSRPHDGERPLIEAVRWLIFQEYNPQATERSWKLASCPTCKSPNIQISQDMGNKFQCPSCGSEVFITDSFRIHEAVDDDAGASGALGYLMAILEQMLLVHLIKSVYEIKRSMLSEILFVKDGPLAFFGQTANMHGPMRQLINFLSATSVSRNKSAISPINIVGVEKSGAFVEHADAIRDNITLNHALVLDNAYIYRYIAPGSGDVIEPFGRSSYYGSKVIFKSALGDVYVLTLPTAEPLISPKAEDMFGFQIILHYISKMKCHMYENALVPVALANKLVSLSDHPSSKLLRLFAKTSTRA